jgi:para-aminobenzoate synthetase / 4-amino-4-deoxychorismate lyase
MLVLGGRPVELEAHLERLRDSLASLFAADLPGGASEAILARARPLELGKLRFTVVPKGNRTLTSTISTTPLERPQVFPARRDSIALSSLVLDGGLGAHKWADRTLLEQAEAGTAAGTVPLLVDRDGFVLEASRGSVFSLRGGRLLTPPEDGRILPGIARRRVIEVAAARGIETREEAIALADLRLGEVFLAGSVRGVEPVRSVDGSGVGPAGELSAELAAGLKRRWLLVPGAGPAAAVAIGQRADRPAR